MGSSIEQRLAETIAWCGIAKRGHGVWFPPPPMARPGPLARLFAKARPILDPRPPLSASIRTAALEAPVLAAGKGGNLIHELIATPAPGRDAVAFVCERRREALSQRGIVASGTRDLAGGRSLSTNFITDECGAATAPSRGFFDLYDVPPWDTWFHHDYDDKAPSGRVYCWVPGDLVSWAQRGLDCIPAHYMRWMDSLDDVNGS